MAAALLVPPWVSQAAPVAVERAMLMALALTARLTPAAVVAVAEEMGALRAALVAQALYTFAIANNALLLPPTTPSATA